MKVEIRHRVTTAVLFKTEVADVTEHRLHIRIALERAVEAGANLAGANLAGADLADANLADANLIDGGQENRGYRFWAWRHKDGHVVYRGGCHEWQAVEDARAHYGDGYTSDGSRAECLARIELMHQCATERGWGE